MRNLPLFCIFCLFLIVVANALIDVSHQARETRMPSFRTIHGGTAELSSSALDSFASRFRGALIREKDAGYDGARRVWNGADRTVLRRRGRSRGKSALRGNTTFSSPSGAAATT